MSLKNVLSVVECPTMIQPVQSGLVLRLKSVLSVALSGPFMKANAQIALTL
jgi:hypothetical protein